MHCSEQRTFAIYCQNLISRVYYFPVLTLSCSTSLFVHHCVHLIILVPNVPVNHQTYTYFLSVLTMWIAMALPS